MMFDIRYGQMWVWLGILWVISIVKKLKVMVVIVIDIDGKLKLLLVLIGCIILMVVLSSMVNVRLKVSVVSQCVVVIQCWCQIRQFIVVVVVGSSICQVFSDVSVVIG